MSTGKIGSNHFQTHVRSPNSSTEAVRETREALQIKIISKIYMNVSGSPYTT
jgi:hypothetical protein